MIFKKYLLKSYHFIGCRVSFLHFHKMAFNTRVMSIIFTMSFVVTESSCYNCSQSNTWPIIISQFHLLLTNQVVTIVHKATRGQGRHLHTVS